MVVIYNGKYSIREMMYKDLLWFENLRLWSGILMKMVLWGYDVQGLVVVRNRETMEWIYNGDIMYIDML